MRSLPGCDPVALLLERARLQPDAPAVVTSDGVVSYRDFGAQVRTLAGALLQVTEQPRVLIRTAQGADAYAAMFASLMAGGSYAPTNIDAPHSHQDRVCDGYRPDVIVGTARDGDVAPVIDPRNPGAAELLSPREATDLAYTIFTSGSSGEPKGVMIPRNALQHYVNWAIPALDLKPGDRCSQHPNIGFDLSVLDIYATLCSGAALVPITGARDRLFPADLVRAMEITVWISVPSVVDLMRKANGVTPEHLASVTRFFFCGEALLPSHLEALFEARPGATVINAYGPTEATVSCTELRLHAEDYQDACAETVALGTPIENMDIELVDGPGVDEGEIIITGPQLARGYWNDAGKTSAAFRRRPDETVEYRSGDWAQRCGGDLFFKRRIDRQIKLHGHRIELGEIDSALREAGVDLAFTCQVRDRLVSFVEGGTDCTPGGLRETLASALPAYAVPKDIRVMTRLPRNDNDKIDRRQLTHWAHDEQH